jgi:YVTN family beta-propeller protein
MYQSFSTRRNNPLTGLLFSITILCGILTSAEANQSKVAADAVPTNTIVGSVALGGTPEFLAISSDDQFVYATLENIGSVAVVDTSTDQVTATYAAGAMPYGIVITPDNQYLYVANGTESGTVTILNAATGALVNTITLTASPYAMAISPDGTLVYAAGYEPGTISVINTAGQTVTSTINMGFQINSVAFAPNGKTAYVTGARTDTAGDLSSVNVAKAKAGSKLPFYEPLDCVVNPKGKHDVYVWNRDSSGNWSIQVVQKHTIINSYSPGVQLGYPAVTPNGKYLYVVQVVPTGEELVAVSTTTWQTVGSPLTIPVSNANVGFILFSHDGKYLYLNDDNNDLLWVVQVAPEQ